MLGLSTLTLAFLQLSSAHFILQYPNSLGFDDDAEDEAPCGGLDVTFGANDSSVPVGGFTVAMLSTHPQAQWLFRATLSQQAPFNWTNILPIVEETGLGDFCIPTLTVPQDFAGQQGLIQVIQNAADGMLYQCAAVNFVDGVNSTVGVNCKNATGLVATITNQNDFNTTAASGTGSGVPSMTMSTSGSQTSATAAATSSSVASGFIPLPNSLFGAVLALPLGFLLG